MMGAPTHWVLIHILVLALISLAFLPALIVGCFEKRAVRMFEAGTVLITTKYLRTAVARALANQFVVRCEGHHIKYNQTLFATLLLSADRLVLALCADGSLHGFRYPLIILLSRFKDGSLLITMDNLGVAELDQMTDLLNTARVGFDEMLRRHTRRLQSRIGPSPFPPNADWSTVNEFYWAKSDRIVARGLAVYVDPHHDYIRYTLWGSFRATVLHGMKILHRPATYIDRIRRRLLPSAS
jgi:hypothetical protein